MRRRSRDAGRDARRRAPTEAEAQSVVDTIQSEGGEAVAVALDVTDHALFERVLNRVVEQQGRLDLLINNAGIIYVGEYYEMDEAYLDQLVQVNISAVMIGTLYAYFGSKSGILSALFQPVIEEGRLKGLAVLQNPPERALFMYLCRWESSFGKRRA